MCSQFEEFLKEIVDVCQGRLESGELDIHRDGKFILLVQQVCILVKFAL